MLMTRLRQLLPLLLLLAAFPAFPTPEDDGAVRWHVYHAFDPQQPAQRLRAGDLRRAVGDRVDVALVELLARRTSDVQLPADVRAWLATEAEAAGSRIYVIDHDTDRGWSGRGIDMARIAVESGLSADVGTDVGVTTCSAMPGCSCPTPLPSMHRSW